MRQFSSVVLSCLWLMLPLAASANVVTLTMDDLPTQVVHSLVHPSGVTFGFTVSGIGHDDALYNGAGPGMTLYTTDPSIEGTTEGVLSLVFASPTSILEFGLAFSDFAPVSQGALVKLYDGANSLISTHSLDATELASGFAETLFSYSGTSVSRATLDLTTSSGPDRRFALDNLKFDNGSGTSSGAVPEPSTIVIWGLLGLCGAATMWRRRMA